MRTLLVRGLLCGMIAALCAFLFARHFGEPQIDLAIAFEAHLHALAGEPPEPEIFSRSIQRGWGLFTAVMVVGTTVGGLFSSACALAYGRLGRLSMRATSGVVACLAYASVVLIPSLKYPPNPPSIGLPATIGLRTELYFSMILISLSLLIAAAILGRYLQPRLGAWNSWTVAGLGYLGSIALIQVVLPTISEVPHDFPATVLWSFRLASLGTQVVLWGTLGLLFGFVCDLAPKRSTVHQSNA